MRLTSFCIVLVLGTSFIGGRVEAQIAERTTFQPGSYAFGPYHADPAPTPDSLVSDETFNEKFAGEEESTKTDWEKTFGANKDDSAAPVVAVSPPQRRVVPYLAYHRDPLTHRYHLIPYEQGYAAVPNEFPQQTSPLNIWVSALPSQSQVTPQVKYMSYYDPDPVILPAEIRMRGAKYGASLGPIPMPTPQPRLPKRYPLH